MRNHQTGTRRPFWRTALLLMIAVGALVTSPIAASAASAAPAPDQQAVHLQQKVANYLAKHPDWRQVSPNKMTIPGGTMTVAAPGDQANVGYPWGCANGHLCIIDGYGNYFDYFYCGFYSFPGAGDGTFRASAR